MDKLLDQARQESDPDKRNEIYAETQQIELDDAAYVPIRSYENLVVYHPSVKGIKLNPIAYLMLGDVELTE